MANAMKPRTISISSQNTVLNLAKYTSRLRCSPQTDSILDFDLRRAGVDRRLERDIVRMPGRRPDCITGAAGDPCRRGW